MTRIVEDKYTGKNRCALSYRVAVACIMTVLAAMPQPAVAQIPGELVPGRQEPVEMPKPKSLPGAIAPRIGGQVAPEASEGLTLTLNEIDLVGARTLTEDFFYDIWAPYLGREISVATLYKIANEITERYAREGYALSFAYLPEQEIDDGGLVTLRAIEGYIEQAVFIGALGPEDKPVTDRIEEMTRKIVRSMPLRAQDLERYLLLMNDLPGYKIETTFSASRTTQGASNLIVKISRKRLNASVGVDNHLSDTLGNKKISVSAQAHGLLTGADTLSVTQNCGFFCNVYNSTSASYSTYLGTEGLRVGMRYDRSIISPDSGFMSLIDFEGENESWTFDVSYPLLRSRQKNLNVGGSFVMTDNQTESFFGALTHDRIRTLEAFTSYDYADTSGAITLVRAALTQGLPVLNHTRDDNLLRSKAFGSSVFTNVGLLATRDQPLGAWWPDMAEYSLYLSGRAQYAAGSSLLSSSQCFYGGAEFGRGYDSGAISGDHCLMASAEVRRIFRWHDTVIQGYGYLDAGSVWLKGEQPAGTDKSMFSHSYGLGARVYYGSYLSGAAEIALPGRSDYVSDGKGSPRVSLSLRLIY